MISGAGSAARWSLGSGVGKAAGNSDSGLYRAMHVICAHTFTVLYTMWALAATLIAT